MPELFQRVVPAAPVRPQGGGRRRYGDRQVLAAIVRVATTGCTWRQPPPGFGPSGPTAHRRFTARSRAVSTPYKESRVRADLPKPARHPQKDVRDHRHARYTTAVPGNEPARAVGRQTIHPAYRRSRAPGETYATVPFNAGNGGIRCTWRGDGEVTRCGFRCRCRGGSGSPRSRRRLPGRTAGRSARRRASAPAPPAVPAPCAPAGRRGRHVPAC
ncbi:transposase [Streptomyces sp. NPDC093681]|uniref:transposase n=1 Tax=Streptomyces sp. NPDC093681 TaxID=3155202 RepID=UPI0021BD1674|nr:transposase [Streptomyces salinarius]